MNQPIRLLVIEDDLDYVEIIKMCLDEPEAMGLKFELERAERLSTGLKLLDASAPFDALLLDLMLPDSRGLETINQVLSKGYEIPILVMTNLGDESLAFEAMRLGAQDFMVKSTSDSRLLKRSIWYAIERRKLLTQTENLIKKAADGMAVIDPGGAVAYVNPAAASVFGLKAGRPFPFPLSPPGETSLIKLEGREAGERTAEIRVTEIQWKGDSARLAMIRDITDLQRIEQLKAEVKERRKLDKLKDAFIGTVSHELRTPLTIVKGAIDNLKEGVAGPLGQRQTEMTLVAHRNIARLARMINNLLDLSRLESGEAKASRRRLSPAPLVEETLENFRLAAGERSLALEKDLPQDLPDLYADPDMLTQVLTNLLDNALRYARSKVAAKARRSENRVLFEVEDDGPGIPPDKIGGLFNKFVQIDRKSGGEGYKGTGLGLAICKEIISLHGGKIWVESRPGGGIAFRFSLPAYSDGGVPAA